MWMCVLSGAGLFACCTAHFCALARHKPGGWCTNIPWGICKVLLRNILLVYLLQVILSTIRSVYSICISARSRALGCCAAAFAALAIAPTHLAIVCVAEGCSGGPGVKKEAGSSEGDAGGDPTEVVDTSSVLRSGAAHASGADVAVQMDALGVSTDMVSALTLLSNRLEDKVPTATTPVLFLSHFKGVLASGCCLFSEQAVCMHHCRNRL